MRRRMMRTKMKMKTRRRNCSANSRKSRKSEQRSRLGRSVFPSICVQCDLIGAYFIIKEREAHEQSAAVREAEIATANPLLNLQAALGQGAEGPSGGSFAVKKRWDDGVSGTLIRLSLLLIDGLDLIFKNQAVNSDKPSGQFVNDLLRTEFHR